MIFANAAVPLAGVVDTAVIGAVGTKEDLAGIALGAVIFNVVYFGFLFLRQSSTGLSAQAFGAGDATELRRVLVRAGLSAGVLGLAVLALRHAIAGLGFAVLQGNPTVEAIGTTYVTARAFGAPGAFLAFALTGWLIGVGRTRAVLAVHAVFSATNVALDLGFVLGLGYGVGGVAAATAMADWCAALAGGVFAFRLWNTSGATPGVWARATFFEAAPWRRLFGMNWDLMVRAWALLAGFAWFANAGARQGTAILAGNHVLLQIVTVWAFVLDAYAYIAESEVGRAIGERSLPQLQRAVRVTSELAFASGFLFMGVTWWAGPAALEIWIADPHAREAALAYLPFCAVIPFLGAAAWQLDGIFIGATRSATMRNASLAAAAIYAGLDLLLTPRFGPTGMWLAFVLYYVARAGTLAVGYPSIERSLSAPR